MQNKGFINLKLIIVVLFIISSFFVPLETYKSWILSVINNIEHLGWGAPVVLAIFHMLCVSLCFPGTIFFEWAAGLLYGVQMGSLLIIISKTCGGGLGFYFGRYFFREWIEEKIKSYEQFQKIFLSIGEDGWKIALMLRLSPFPSWLNTYGLSLTRISFKDFMIATMIGGIPMILQNVYVGSLVQNLSDTKSQGGWLSIISGGLMVVMTLLLSKYADL